MTTLSPLLVLTPELLHYSFKWSHRLGNTDHPSIEFTLADGLRVRGEEIRGVLNRMPVLPSRLVSGLPPPIARMPFRNGPPFTSAGCRLSRFPS